MTNRSWLNATTSIDMQTSSMDYLRQCWLRHVPCQRLSRIKFFVIDVSVGASLGISAGLMHSYLSQLRQKGPFGAVVEMSIMMATQMLLCFVLGGIAGSMEVMIPGGFVGLFAMALPFVPARMGSHEIFIEGVLGALTFSLFTIWNTFFEGRIQPVLPLPANFRFVPVSKASLRLPWWLYDAIEYAGSRRRSSLQKRLFSKIRGKTLFVAAGTGLNFRNLPCGAEIVAIDVDRRKLARAQQRAQAYGGTISVQHADVQQLTFADSSFDSIATASTLCSVPDPVAALKQMHRVLKPGGKLLMFEHVRSRNLLVGTELDLLSPIMCFLGPVINRDTVAAVQTAGFTVDLITCGYLDVFLLIEAHKAAEC
jgi:SAM-dependent methyltransferase